MDSNENEKDAAQSSEQENAQSISAPPSFNSSLQHEQGNGGKSQDVNSSPGGGGGGGGEVQQSFVFQHAVDFINSPFGTATLCVLVSATMICTMIIKYIKRKNAVAGDKRPLYSANDRKALELINTLAQVIKHT